MIKWQNTVVNLLVSKKNKLNKFINEKIVYFSEILVEAKINNKEGNGYGAITYCLSVGFWPTLYTLYLQTYNK